MLVPAPDAGGIGLWSRFPLAEVSPAKLGTRRSPPPGCRSPMSLFDPLVASVHVTSPLQAYGKPFGDWRSGITSTKAVLDRFADAAGPGSVIVAGDFNSTPDMRQFRDLLTNGYRDAVEQTGAGFAPTFPSNTLLPPLITIDHVLTRHAAASSIRAIDLRGSDHRSVLATVDVPLDPAASSANG